VWFILGGGAIFAAFPMLYAVTFSGFYLAMFVVLVALILRPVAFKFRSKEDAPRWRSIWDWALFVSGVVPPLIFGVAVGNVLQGVPYTVDPELRSFYSGSFFGLLNPFALLCGVLSVAMLTMHGAAWLSLKTSGAIATRARTYGFFAAAASVVLFALGGAIVATLIDGYVITSQVDPNGPSNPLLKTVETVSGGWMANYAAYPWMMIAPALGLAGAALAALGFAIKRDPVAFIGSFAGVFGIVATVGVSMFPFILPNSEQPVASLTVWDATSSHTTLFIMLIATAIFLPIVLAYTAWAFKVLWGKVEEEHVDANAASWY
jgi:cytochrome d ubiquinol oxidase subunit II